MQMSPTRLDKAGGFGAFVESTEKGVHDFVHHKETDFFLILFFCFVTTKCKSALSTALIQHKHLTLDRVGS